MVKEGQKNNQDHIGLVQEAAIIDHIVRRKDHIHHLAVLRHLDLTRHREVLLHPGQAEAVEEAAVDRPAEGDNIK